MFFQQKVELPEEHGTYEIVPEGGKFALYMNLKGSPYLIQVGLKEELEKLVEKSGFVSQIVKRKAEQAKAKVEETTRGLFDFFFKPKEEKIKKKVKVIKAPKEDKMKDLFKNR